MAETVNETICGRDTKGADGIVSKEQINSHGTGGNDSNDKGKQRTEVVARTGKRMEDFQELAVTERAGTLSC